MSHQSTLLLLTTLVLAASLPPAVLAAYGFRDAPFGGILRPIPVVLAAYLVVNIPMILGVATPAVFHLVLSTAAIGAALLAAVRGALLLSGRWSL
ncbi:hypothetical protein [Halobaculum sp. D14]|uniref:hypothetical protein n=1 Tax=unclassified Halobaculum TaxID=2640896 RepID=UPI003EBCECA1